MEELDYNEALSQASYRSRLEKFSDFYDFVLANRNNPQEQNKSFYRFVSQDGAAIDVPFSNIVHVFNRHGLTSAQFEEILNNLTNITDASILDGRNGPFQGIPVSMKITTPSGTAGVQFDFVRNGNIQLVTAFYDSKANIDDWIEKSGSRRRLVENSTIVSTGNHSSVRNIQQALGIVNDGGVYYQFVGTPRGKRMFASHTVTDKTLANIMKANGFTAPSLAITNEENPLFSGYGNITFIAPKLMIDPQGDVDTRVFAVDAYTPMYPDDAQSPEEALERMRGDGTETIRGAPTVTNVEGLRAQYAPEFGSVEEIQRARNNLVSQEDFSEALGREQEVMDHLLDLLIENNPNLDDEETWQAQRTKRTIEKLKNGESLDEMDLDL
jgi:hypothetical protein